MAVCAFLIPKPFHTFRKERRGEPPTRHRRERKEPNTGILFYKLILYIYHIKDSQYLFKIQSTPFGIDWLVAEKNLKPYLNLGDTALTDERRKPRSWYRAQGL